MATDIVPLPEVGGSILPARRSLLDQVRRYMLPRRRRLLALILGLSAFGNFYQLQQNGIANLYYAAAIRSMLESWHNFFFVAFDPGGFVSIDKPPLGFWIQVVSARLLGYSGFSILLPEALAGGQQGGARMNLPLVTAALGVALLLVGPATWVGISLASGAGGTLPAAGPSPTVALLTGRFGEIPRGRFGGGFPGAFPEGFSGGFPFGGPRRGRFSPPARKPPRLTSLSPEGQ